MSGNVCPDKCWFAVLCRFWPYCNRTRTRRPRRQPGSAVRMRRPWLFTIVSVEDRPLLVVHDRLFNLLAPAVPLTEQNCSPGTIQPRRLLSFVIGWTFRTVPQGKMRSMPVICTMPHIVRKILTTAKRILHNQIAYRQSTFTDQCLVQVYHQVWH
jgi:hypothetical protein